MNSSTLTFVTFLPLAGALVLVLFPRRDAAIRWFALGVSLITFAASLRLPLGFENRPGFQFEVDHAWIASPNIHYHLGVDGLSLWLVVMTAFLVPLSVLISWKIGRAHV